MTTTVDPEARLRAPHTRTAVLGLLLVVAALLVFISAELASGASLAQLAAIFAPFLIIPAVVAWLAWRFGTWSKVLAAIVGLLLIGLNAPHIVPALSRPASFFEFVGVSGYAVGAVLAVVGGVAAVVMRHDARAEATLGEQRVRTFSLAGIGALAVLSGVVALTTTAAVDEAARAGATELTVAAYDYGDGTVEVAAGEPTTLVVSNDDAVFHTFTVEELGVDVELLPGREALVELPAIASGETYTIVCTPHPGMEATLTAR